MWTRSLRWSRGSSPAHSFAQQSRKRAVAGRTAAGNCRLRERNDEMTGSFNVLFLCTGNSARSIMAEAILNHKAKGVFRAYSAGSRPSGTARPEALRQLELARISTEGLRSKSWDEFAAEGAPKLDFIF